MDSLTTDAAVERARNLVNQPDSADIRQAWHDLRRSHRVARRSGCELPAFPNWVLEQRIPAEVLQLMLTAEYGEEDAKRLSRRPLVCRNFGVPWWHFVLFIGGITYRMAGNLSRVSKAKAKNVSFEIFYRELKQIRDKRHHSRTPSSLDADLPPCRLENALGFKPSDIEVYMPNPKRQKKIRRHKKPVSESGSERKCDIDSDMTHETADGPSNGETIHMRTRSSGYDVISLTDSEDAGEDDFAHVSEGIYPRDDDGDFRDDDAALSDRSGCHSVSGEAFNAGSPTPTLGHPMVASEEDAPSFGYADSLIPPATTPNRSRSVVDAVNSATIQIAEDQGRQQAEQESTLAFGTHVGSTTAAQEANDPPNPASHETGGEKQTDAVRQSLLTEIATIKERLRSCESLDNEYVQLHQEKDAILSQIKVTEDQYERRFRTTREQIRSTDRCPPFTRTEKSEIMSDIERILDKRSPEGENLRQVKAKRVKLDADIKRLVDGRRNCPSCSL